MNDILLFAGGIALGSVGAWLIMHQQSVAAVQAIKEQCALAIEAAKQQSNAAIEAAKSTLLQGMAQNAERERTTFLTLAEKSFTPITKDLTAIGQLMEAMQRNNVALQTSIGHIEKQYISLSEATNRVSNNAEALVAALRNPTTRGRWGEIQLRRVVELAGMTEWCDFDEQTGITEGDGRPDLTVHLPGDQCIYVDAKVPLAAYLEMLEEGEDQRRAELRREHVRAVKSHIDVLAKRGYHLSGRGSTSFVVMFVPGESFLHEALIAQQDLLEYAASKNVYLCGPLTLMPLLKSYALGWREQQQEQRAKEIAKLGADLYDRLCVFASHFSGIGSALAKANEAYNSAVGSFERRLLPQGRRIKESAALDSDEIESPKVLDAAPRQIALLGETDDNL